MLSVTLDRLAKGVPVDSLRAVSLDRDVQALEGSPAPAAATPLVTF